jgi:hypothetical protein
VAVLRLVSSSARTVRLVGVWLQLKDPDASVFEGEAFDEIQRVYTAIRNIKDKSVPQYPIVN